MALNAAMLRGNGQPVPLPNEKLFHATDSVSITFALLGPGLSVSKSGPALASSLTGRAFVTSRRLLVVADVARSSSSAPFQSLTAPLSHVLDGRLVQPVFGANRWEATIRPVAQGGLNSAHHLTITFTGSRAWEFVSAFDECRRRSEEEAGVNGPEGEALLLDESCGLTPKHLLSFDKIDGVGREFTLTTPVALITLINASNLTLFVRGKVLTSRIELAHCRNVEVVVEVPLSIVQLDGRLRDVTVIHAVDDLAQATQVVLSQSPHEPEGEHVEITAQVAGRGYNATLAIYGRHRWGMDEMVAHALNQSAVLPPAGVRQCTLQVKQCPPDGEWEWTALGLERSSDGWPEMPDVLMRPARRYRTPLAR